MEKKGARQEPSPLLKTEVRLLDYLDYVDREVFVLLPMFEKRLKTYRAIGYTPDEVPIDGRVTPEMAANSSKQRRRFAM